VFNNCVAVDDRDPNDQKIYVSLQDKPVILSGTGEVPEGVSCYTFDHCLPPGVPQETVYERLVKPAVQSVFNGINSTVFAYGQTGTGKTFTMQGDLKDRTLMGMTPRAVHDLFEHYAGQLGVI
jgi:hypothetical protein